MTTARRIASLLPGATEMLYAIGLGDRVVAVSHECDYPPEVCQKPRVTRSLVASERPSREIDDHVRRLLDEGSSLYEIDEDRLARLNPDLIVTQAQCDVCAVNYEDVVRLVDSRHELRGSKIVALNPASLEDILTDVPRIGEAAGQLAAAERLTAQLQARIEAVREKIALAASRRRPRVACIEWIEPLMLSGNWVPQLVQLAGGQCPLTEAGRPSIYWSWDDVARLDPETIVIMPCGFDLARSVRESQALAQLAGWRDLAAVREGRVYAVDGHNYFNRGGPRIVDSLEMLAHLIHPELIDPPLAPAERERAWCRLPSDGGLTS